MPPINVSAPALPVSVSASCVPLIESLLLPEVAVEPEEHLAQLPEDLVDALTVLRVLLVMVAREEVAHKLQVVREEIPMLHPELMVKPDH